MKDLWQLVVFGGLAAVLFVPLVVSDGMFFPFITGKNFTFRILVEITLAAWVLLALYDLQYRPRFSWLLPAAGSLLAVMLLANLLGEHPAKSFWSNYERMDGYVTLLHFVGYFMVLGSVLSHRTVTFLGRSTTPWYAFMVTALVAAAFVMLTAFRQLTGMTENTRDGWRINGSLGNAAYMAIYMLFNVFIALWVLIQTKISWGRIAAGVFAVLAMFLLVQTGTRGTLIGFAGGTIVGAFYVALFNRTQPIVRNAALGLLAFVVVGVGLLFAFKDSSFVNDNTILNRMTAISLTELNLRMEIWQTGFVGVAENPLLGWGQGNFNYVFNEYYNPDIAGRAEEWYDRGHNIAVDWLSNGGILGLIAYASIWIALAYYLFVLPFTRKDLPGFSVTERGLLIGILVGYFIHNLVVFDNIVSYIFFAVLLALIHSRVSESAPAWPKNVGSVSVITNVVTPVVLVVCIVVVYIINVPSMRAAQDMIDAFQASNPSERLELFVQAFDRGGFATQEITEQLTQQAVTIVASPQVPDEVKLAWQQETESRLAALIREKPGDARVHVFAASYYRNSGNIDAAREQAAQALKYSPNKPSIMFEQGYIEFQAGETEAMLERFAAAHALNPENRAAQVAYAAVLLGTGASEDQWRAVITTERAYTEFLSNRFAQIMAQRANNNLLLEEMFIHMTTRNPNTLSHWLSLSFVQYQLGESEKAIATLQETASLIPEAAPTAGCFIANIEAGLEPNTGC